jgi:transcriptional regulator with XRE-family HTH domain
MNGATMGYISDMKTGRPGKQERTPFGERVAQARELAGLTQQQVADKLGTTQRVIAYWEREPVALRAEQLAALAETLNVSSDHLLGRPDAKSASLKGPTGKSRQFFEAVSKLPRQQQEKIFTLLQPFADQYNQAS